MSQAEDIRPGDRATAREGDIDCSFCAIEQGSGEIGATNPQLEQSYDIPIQTDVFIIFPDAAPIGPRHSLIVPRKHVLSFARLRPDRQVRAHKLLNHLSAQLVRPDDYLPYFFEHGSNEGDEGVGCGITHAHLHFLYVPADCLDGDSHIDGFHEYPSLRAAWTNLGSEDYYLYGHVDKSVRATFIQESPKLKCSMFLRKWFSSKIGRPELGDYRRYQDGRTDDMLDEISTTQSCLMNIKSAELH